MSENHNGRVDRHDEAIKWICSTLEDLRRQGNDRSEILASLRDALHERTSIIEGRLGRWEANPPHGSQLPECSSRFASLEKWQIISTVKLGAIIFFATAFFNAALFSVAWWLRIKLLG